MSSHNQWRGDMSSWVALLCLVLSLILGFLIWFWTWQKKFPQPAETYHLLERAPLKKVVYNHTRKINGQSPRYVVGNSHIAVAYWRTKHSHDDVVETILFLHPTKKGEVVATFRSGLLVEWSWAGAPGRPLDDQDTRILQKILAKVKAAHL